MGILSDKLLWGAGPTGPGGFTGFSPNPNQTYGDYDSSQGGRAGIFDMSGVLMSRLPTGPGGNGGVSPAGLNRPSTQTSTGKIANSTSLLDSGVAQVGAALAGAAVPGLGLGLNAVNAAQNIARENAQRELLGMPEVGLGRHLLNALDPFTDINPQSTQKAFGKQMATRQKSAAINAADAAGASGRDGLRGSPQVADLTSTTKSRKQAFMGRPEAKSTGSLNFGAAPKGLGPGVNRGGGQGRSGSGVGGAGAKGGGGFGGRPGRSGSGLGGPDRNGPAGNF